MKKNHKARWIIGGLIVVAIVVFFNFGRIYTELMLLSEEHAGFTVEGENAYMKGVISGRTIGRVKALIKDHPEVTTIVMTEVPGSVDDEANLVASRLVRAAGLNTEVPEGGFIASGGVDFFCAGVTRTAHENSTIGVHSWAAPGMNNANELPKDHEEHERYLSYYKEMDIPEDFYWFTIAAAPAEGMHNMTQEERITYKVIKPE